MNRKHLAVISLALVAVIALASCVPFWPGAPAAGPQQQQGGMMGGQGGMMGGQGGMMGGQGGMMGGQGGMMGGQGGMMGGQGGMMGGQGGMMGGQGNYNPQARPITIDQAASAVRRYLNGYDSGLTLAEVMEFANNFYAEVEEEGTGIHAMELLIDKYTGQVYPEMGPNMMWNTRYGMMTQMMGGRYTDGAPTAMQVTPEQARALAQQFLDDSMPGITVADADAFYGYYTLHTSRGGQVEGMLSVNGYTGAVWYHDWHGPFIDMQEFNDEGQ
ncbi:MAG: hypothetical protein HY669_02380 [Chloroflexi bacterium]|nr:hypothetical protein [Chloroflexota bacterium]